MELVADVLLPKCKGQQDPIIGDYFTGVMRSQTVEFYLLLNIAYTLNRLFKAQVTIIFDAQ